MKRGRPSPGYVVFNCQGLKLGEFKSMGEAADYYQANINTVNTAYYHKKHFRGRCFVAKDKIPNSIKELLSMIRQYDSRYIGVAPTGEVRYFDTAKEAKQVLGKGTATFKGREAERYFTDEQLLEAEPINKL